MGDFVPTLSQGWGRIGSIGGKAWGRGRTPVLEPLELWNQAFLIWPRGPNLAKTYLVSALKRVIGEELASFFNRFKVLRGQRFPLVGPRCFLGVAPG